TQRRDECVGGRRAQPGVDVVEREVERRAATEAMDRGDRDAFAGQHDEQGCRASHEVHLWENREKSAKGQEPLAVGHEVRAGRDPRCYLAPAAEPMWAAGRGRMPQW